MENLYILSINYVLLSFVFLTSILGYGKLANNFILKKYFFLNYKNFLFIAGLVFIGLFSIPINFFYPLNNSFSLIIISLGTIIYLYYLYRDKNFINESIFLFVIVLLSYFFSFFSGLSDDFEYHFLTINNFKQLVLFETVHNGSVSYNSHWLFLNSIFYLSFFKASLFILTSLLYSITIYDFFSNYKKFLQKNLFFLGFYISFVLVFLLGVLNIYKDFGTDVPGVIICIYIFIFYAEIILYKSFKLNLNTLILIILFANFAITIKITNSLIYLFILILFFIFDNKNKIFPIILLAFIPLSFWIFQNISISDCLIWPISFLCFSNIEAAERELRVIESFAKGDIMGSMHTNGFAWILIWFKNHFYKLVETYLLYFIILFTPIIYFNLKYGLNIISLFIKLLSKDNIKKFYLFFLPIILSNIIWFFYAPAYRFGIFYNLTALIMLLIPFWTKIYAVNKYKTVNIIKIIILIVLILFIYENIFKYNWYINKYGFIWPPIINNELIMN